MSGRARLALGLLGFAVIACAVAFVMGAPV
jgi:hypothetical protein